MNACCCPSGSRSRYRSQVVRIHPARPSGSSKIVSFGISSVRRGVQAASKSRWRSPSGPHQGPAVVLGMAGALLVASPAVRTRRAGFGCWIVGNLLWVITGFVHQNVYSTVIFGFFTGLQQFGAGKIIEISFLRNFAGLEVWPFQDLHRS